MNKLLAWVIVSKANCCFCNVFLTSKAFCSAFCSSINAFCFNSICLFILSLLFASPSLFKSCSVFNLFCKSEISVFIKFWFSLDKSISFWFLEIFLSNITWKKSVTLLTASVILPIPVTNSWISASENPKTSTGLNFVATSSFFFSAKSFINFAVAFFAISPSSAYFSSKRANSFFMLSFSILLFSSFFSTNNSSLPFNPLISTSLWSAISFSFCSSFFNAKSFWISKICFCFKISKSTSGIFPGFADNWTFEIAACSVKFKFSPPPLVNASFSTVKTGRNQKN